VTTEPSGLLLFFLGERWPRCWPPRAVGPVFCCAFVNSRGGGGVVPATCNNSGKFVLLLARGNLMCCCLMYIVCAFWLVWLPARCLASCLVGVYVASGVLVFWAVCLRYLAVLL